MCTFVVRSLGCWRIILEDPQISDKHGPLGVHGCYNLAKSQGNTVFGLLYGTECYTTSTAGDTYKKYGRWNCNFEVHEIENGNSLCL